MTERMTDEERALLHKAAEAYEDEQRKYQSYEQQLLERISELEAKLERVRELPEYAVQTGGWGGWEIVPAEGFEAQTFVDKDQLDAALKETDNE